MNRKNPSIANIDRHQEDQTDVKVINETHKENQEQLKQEMTTKPPNILYVIVFGYPRTGSTFTADLLKQNPNAFYLYEPFFDVIR